MDATDCLTEGSIEVVPRIDVAAAVEVQVVREATARRSRPGVAVEADIVETAIANAAITQSRVPDGAC